MTGQEVTQENFEALIEDAEYLQDEAEALKYVIDAVPYSEVPQDGMSIYQKLCLIDHAQSEYFRPILEKVIKSPRMLVLSGFKHYSETFETPDPEDSDVQKILNKIIKHRAGLINVFRKVPLIDWERGIKDKDDHIISLYDFANRMVKEERAILKEIADLILIYQNNKRQNREVNRRAQQRETNGDN